MWQRRRLQAEAADLIIHHQVYLQLFVSIRFGERHMCVFWSFGELPVFWGSCTDFLQPQQCCRRCSSVAEPCNVIALIHVAVSRTDTQHAADLGRLVVFLFELDLFLKYVCQGTSRHN